MNIFEREANDIVNYLERHGYEAAISTDKIVVQDPALFAIYENGHRKYTHTPRIIYTWRDAIHFVEERS